MAPHGSPRDRGDNDSGYGRERRPHKWVWPTVGRMHQEVELVDVDEVAEYLAGYSETPFRLYVERGD